MRILHTADLHIGQVIYQNYDRTDEHTHFFNQLAHWCQTYQPDALVVSGDIFDIQQPSATTKRFFTDTFVALQAASPSTHIVITAGNHDSASRLQAEASVWKCVRTHLVGVAPALDKLTEPDGWQEQFIIRLTNGYIIALPYMLGNRQPLLQAILDYVANENSEGKPVVMMGHLAANIADVTGHNFEIGKVTTQTISELGEGYDYCALGHIHRPQTLGYPLTDEQIEESSYPAGVVRYAGSALHVSCDEKYPHTVSLIDIDRHGGEVRLKRLRINELRHFYQLPIQGQAAQSYDEIIQEVTDFIQSGGTGYFRLRIAYQAVLPPDFNQRIYQLLEGYEDSLRYNPKILWSGSAPTTVAPVANFEVAELQEMDDPMLFIEKTISQYADLELDKLRDSFQEVQRELQQMQEEIAEKTANSKNAKSSQNENEVIELDF